MSFIGNSRKSYANAWYNYVCLDEEDCRMILKSIKQIVIRKTKNYQKWYDIHEGGEMTNRQSTAMLKAEEEYERAQNMAATIEAYLNLMRGGTQ